MSEHVPITEFKPLDVQATPTSRKPHRARGKYRLEPDIARAARTLTALVRAHATAGYGQGHPERIMIDADGVFVEVGDDRGVWWQMARLGHR